MLSPDFAFETLVNLKKPLMSNVWEVFAAKLNLPDDIELNS